MAKYNSAQVVITETDVSALAAEAFGHPYLVLGETSLGRDDSPVNISNKANFVANFGGTSTSMPGTYSAMEYLSFGNQLIFKRVTSTKFLKIQTGGGIELEKANASYSNKSTVKLNFILGALLPYFDAVPTQVPAVLFFKPVDGTAPIKVYVKKYLGSSSNNQYFEILWDSYGADFDLDSRISAGAINCDVYIGHSEKSFNSNVLFPKKNIVPATNAFTYDITEKAWYSSTGLSANTYYVTSYTNSSMFGSLKPALVAQGLAGGPATGTYKYRFTFTNGTIESAASAEASITTAGGSNYNINVTFPDLPNGYTGFNLYRTVIGGAGDFKKVNSTPINTFTFVDSVVDGSLGTVLPVCPITIYLNGVEVINSTRFFTLDSTGLLSGDYIFVTFGSTGTTWHSGTSPEPKIGDIFYKSVKVLTPSTTYPNSGASLIGDGSVTGTNITGNFYTSSFIPHIQSPGFLTATIPTAPTVALAGTGIGNVDNGTHYYAVSFVGPWGETTPGLISSVVTVADKSANGQVAVSNIPLGPVGTTARNIYRTHANLGITSTYYLIGTNTVPDNNTIVYTDNIADLSATVVAPVGNPAGTYNYRVTYVTANGETELGSLSATVTAANQSILLSSIPTAANGLGVIGRNIYRSKTGPTGSWFLAAVLNDTDVTYLDNSSDTSLGVEGTNLINDIYTNLFFYNGINDYKIPNNTDNFKSYLTLVGSNYYYYSPNSFDRYAALSKGRGIWANGISLYSTYNQTTREYELVIYDTGGRILERWSYANLSDLVTNVSDFSSYITLTNLSDNVSATGFVQYDISTTGSLGSAEYYRALLSGGYDGFSKDVLAQTVDESDFIANIDVGTAGAKYTLDPDFADLVSTAQQIESYDGGLDFEVITIPGFSDYPAVASKMTTISESRKFTCALLDIPAGLNANAAIQYRTTQFASIASSYAAIYWNYGKVYDSINQVYVWLPPSVFAIRALAVTDTSGTPYAAAAGLRRGLVPEILDLEFYPALGDRENLQGVQINPLAKIGNTIAIWGNKTAQSFKSMLSNFNVRRLLISAEKAVYITSQASLFEPNDKIERQRLMLSIQPIFDTIRQQRGLLAFLITDSTTDSDTAENIARFTIALQPTPTMEIIYQNVIVKNPTQDLSANV